MLFSNGSIKKFNKLLLGGIIGTMFFPSPIASSSVCFASEDSSVTVLGGGETDSSAIDAGNFSGYDKINSVIDEAILFGRCPTSSRDSAVGAMECAESLGLLGIEYNGWRDNDDKLLAFLQDNPAFDKYMNEDEISLLASLSSGASILGGSGALAGFLYDPSSSEMVSGLWEYDEAFHAKIAKDLAKSPNGLPARYLKYYAQQLEHARDFVNSGQNSNLRNQLETIYELRAGILENMAHHLRSLGSGGQQEAVAQSVWESAGADNEMAFQRAIQNNLKLAELELESAGNFASANRVVSSGTINTAKAGVEALKDGMDMQLFATANPALEAEAVQAREVVAGGAEAGATAGAFGWMTPAVMTAGAVGALAGGALWAGASKLAAWYQDEHEFIEDEMETIRSGDSPD